MSMTWDNFTGQEPVKRELMNLVFHPHIHVLLKGNSGHGKTELAKMFAAYKGPWTYQSAEFVGVPNPEAVTHVVDEVHRIKHPSRMFAAMDKTGFVFCTTEAADIKETLVNRCVVLSLEQYSEVQLVKIVMAAVPQITNELLATLVTSRCRGVPRTVIQLANRLHINIGANVSLEQAEQYYNEIGVFEGGYTRDDARYIQYLQNTGRPTSVASIASGLGLSVKIVTDNIEPWLIFNGLVIRTSRGRVLSPANQGGV